MRCRDGVTRIYTGYVVTYYDNQPLFRDPNGTLRFWNDASKFMDTYGHNLKEGAPWVEIGYRYAKYYTPRVHTTY